MYLSILNLIAIAVDRHLVVCRPLLHGSFAGVTLRNVTLAMYPLMAVVCSPPLFLLYLDADGKCVSSGDSVFQTELAVRFLLTPSSTYCSLATSISIGYCIQMTYNILIIMRIVLSISRIYSNIYLYINIRFFLKVHFLYRDSWSDGQYFNISHVYNVYNVYIE